MQHDPPEWYMIQKTSSITCLQLPSGRPTGAKAIAAALRAVRLSDAICPTSARRAAPFGAAQFWRFEHNSHVGVCETCAFTVTCSDDAASDQLSTCFDLIDIQRAASMLNAQVLRMTETLRSNVKCSIVYT